MDRTYVTQNPNETDPYLHASAIGSDGTHIYLAQGSGSKLKALLIPQSGELIRKPAKDVPLDATRTDRINGMWSDGQRFWVASYDTEKGNGGAKSGVFVYAKPSQ